MKKLLLVVLLFAAVFTLAGCGGGDGDTNKDDGTNDPLREIVKTDCEGYGDFIVVNGKCILIEDILSSQITINGDETRVNYGNSIELMNNFVADVEGSQGLAVIPRDVYNAAIELGGTEGFEMINLAADETDDTTANIIVSLNASGFFEEVSFSDDYGVDVEVTSNPLALEVYGDFTIIVFEVNLGYQQEDINFTQKIWNSLASGGIYVIHNESGKMFATKDIEMTENSWTYEENHSRNLFLTVTLNEPVIEIQQVFRLDAEGKPMFDDDGFQLFDEVEVPLLDADGNPLIYTEGPFLFETIETPVVEYYNVQEVDENGDPVFDADGLPVFQVLLDTDGNPVLDEDGFPELLIEEVAVLDENGNPKVEVQEVPVLDADGNPTYQPQFDVEIYIEDIVQITETNYQANVTDNPLSYIAQRFIDKIISEYYNWNYYRVNDYALHNQGFAATDEGIFYMEQKQDSADQSKTSNFVMKLSYDTVTDEILLEEYLNTTKVLFTECEIMLDPRNGNIICDSWEGNIKIYSATDGLKIIDDSENLNPVTFPNGELYFYEYSETFVEELGYYTTLLYNINSNGTLESHYIELGEKDQVCYDMCVNYISTDLYDQNGDLYSEYGYTYVQISNGEKLIQNADLQLASVGTFDSVRPECDNEWDCWYQSEYVFLNVGGDEFARYEYQGSYSDTDTPPSFGETYQFDEFTVFEYEQQSSDIDLVCDNEVGCTNYMYFVDESIDNYGLYIWDNMVFEDGETMINRMTINETNTAIYEYTKDIEGTVCTYTTCEEIVRTLYYDIEGELLSEYWAYMDIPQDEIIPLYIEYRVTVNTTLVEDEGVCTTSTGCWRGYNNLDEIYYGINYEQGDTMYESITFAESDKLVVTEETLTNEVCLEVDGCEGNEVTYTVVDDNDIVLYEFSEYRYNNYSYKLPFNVTVNINDITIENAKEWLQENAICEDTTCNRSVEVGIGTINDYDYIDWVNVEFQENDEIVYRVIMADDTVVTSIDNKVCMDDDGCTVYTENYSIVDDLDNDYTVTNEDWYNGNLEVFFAYGEIMPTTNDFEATFTITNVEYSRIRMSTYDFINSLHEVVILDENIYLIESPSWSQGKDNFVLLYDELEGVYKAMYTNISAVTEIAEFGDGYIAINDDKNAILKFSYDVDNSDDSYYFFNVDNLTEDESIFAINDLIIDYDGSIYFKGIDGFAYDMTGTIDEFGVVTIDTEIVEREIIRLRPIN